MGYWAAHDAGKIINPLSAEGQVEGGIGMGLGMAFWEKIVREDGRILNPNYLNYLLPGASDIPPVTKTIFVESTDRTGPLRGERNGRGEHYSRAGRHRRGYLRRHWRETRSDADGSGVHTLVNAGTGPLGD
jgi:hypothetical protein